MADRYPETQIIDVDLSPIQPNWVPPNVKFEIDDIEDNWTCPKDPFDIIYSQFMLSGSVAKFQKQFTQAFE